MINRSNQILSAVLVIQLILVGIVFFPKSNKAPVTSGPLLANFNKDNVKELRITDKDGKEIHLTRNDIGVWVLPEYDDFPTKADAVSSFLDKIAGLQANRLIATNSSSHNRLRVGENAFERLIEINGGDQKLYLGSSAGANATHMRVNGDDRVYLTSGLSSFDANVNLSAWINPQYFSVDSANVTALTLQNSNGLFEFVKQNDEWVYLGLQEGETFNQNAFNTLLNQATAVRMTAPISRQEDPSFGMDDPSATITLTVMEPAPSTVSNGQTEAPAATEAAQEPVATEDAMATEAPTEMATEAAVDPTEAPTEAAMEATEAPTDAAMEATEAPTETAMEATEAPTEAATEAPAEPQMVQTTYTLKLGAVVQDTDYAFKASSEDYYVRVSTNTANGFINRDHVGFTVVPAADATPGANTAPGGNGQ